MLPLHQPRLEGSRKLESNEAEALFPIIFAVLFLVAICGLCDIKMRPFFNFAIQDKISFQHFIYTGLSNLESSSKVLVPRGTYIGLNNIPVQGCSLAAAASMDSHEEGEGSTVWCYRHCSPSPPSLIALLLAHPLDRGSLSWTATHHLLQRGFCDYECDFVLGLVLTAHNTA